MDSANSALQERIAAQSFWYHTIELAPGVVTPGWFDTRSVVDRVGVPQSLEGKRCLDVGTFDGFWAFEMERRGAKEVVALDAIDPSDWDWPAGSQPDTFEVLGDQKSGGSGYEIAHEALNSKVERVAATIYDLDPDRVGTFDFVYLGSILLHLRDPVGALMKVAAVCQGQLLSVDAYDIGLTVAHPRRPVAGLDGVGRPWWWKANIPGIVRMLEAGGFRPTSKPTRFMMPPGAGQPKPKLTPGLLRNKHSREEYLRVTKGDPHVAVSARPS